MRNQVELLDEDSSPRPRSGRLRRPQSEPSPPVLAPDARLGGSPQARSMSARPLERPQYASSPRRRAPGRRARGLSIATVYQGAGDVAGIVSMLDQEHPAPTENDDTRGGDDLLQRTDPLAHRVPGAAAARAGQAHDDASLRPRGVADPPRAREAGKRPRYDERMRTTAELREGFPRSSSRMDHLPFPSFPLDPATGGPLDALHLGPDAAAQALLLGA